MKNLALKSLLRPFTRALSRDILRLVIYFLRQSLEGSIRRTKSNPARLQLARMYGYISWATGWSSYSADQLEELIYQNLRQPIEFLLGSAKHLDHHDSHGHSDSHRWLHVCSETWELGGHTRLLCTLVKGLAMRELDQTVLATRRFHDRHDHDLAPARIVKAFNHHSGIERITAVVQAGLASDVIVLHIHPDDIEASVAARFLKSKGKKVLFVNHADHVFSFGFGSSNIILEVSGFGWKLSRDKRVPSNQSFLGIPIAEQFFSEDNELIPSTSITDKLIAGTPIGSQPIVSVGSPYKYRPVGDQDFPALVKSILSQTDRHFCLIGSSGFEPWWNDIRRIYSNRVQFKGSLPVGQVMKILSQSDLYIDSFPLTGGTVFSEALMLGCTVFGLKNSACGYSPADILKSPTQELLLKEILAAIQSPLPCFAVQNQVREIVRKQFSVDSVVDRLLLAAQGNLVALPSALSQISYDTSYYACHPAILAPIVFLNLPANQTSLLQRIRMLPALLLAKFLLPHAMPIIGLLRWLPAGEL